MRKNHLISVVIPTFNEKRFLSRVLQSLLRQSFKSVAKGEIIATTDADSIAPLFAFLEFPKNSKEMKN